MDCCDCPKRCHVYTKCSTDEGRRETYTCWMCHKRCNPSFAPQKQTCAGHEKRDSMLLQLKTMKITEMNRKVSMRDDAWM